MEYAHSGHVIVAWNCHLMHVKFHIVYRFILTFILCNLITFSLVSRLLREEKSLGMRLDNILHMNFYKSTEASPKNVLHPSSRVSNLPSDDSGRSTPSMP